MGDTPINGHIKSLETTMGNKEPALNLVLEVWQCRDVGATLTVLFISMLATASVMSLDVYLSIVRLIIRSV